MRAIIGVVAICLASSASAQILPADPVFANAFESGALSLAPNASYIALGASGDTLPTALTLTLSEPVASDTFVPIVSAAPARLSVNGNGVTVLAGQKSATVQVSGLAGGATPVTLTASLGNAISAGVRVEAALNESGSASGEADYCNIQFPTAFNIAAGQVSEPIYAQLYQAGVTDLAGPPPGWIAALGYGPLGADPRLLYGWQFVDASYGQQYGNNDEYSAILKAPWGLGPYVFVFRFSQDQGVSWTYCDTDGAGANNGLDFEMVNLGQMTVEQSLVVNEVDYDNIGTTEASEFIEIHNPSSTAVSLTGIALVLVNGINSAEYRRMDLGAAGMLPADGYLVVQDGSLTLPPGTPSLNFANCTSNCIQNGAPDGIALIDTVSSTVIDALSYEGSITAANIVGFATPVNLVEGTALQGTVADSNIENASLIRNPDGTDTDNANSDWVYTTTPTPGAANSKTP